MASLAALLLLVVMLVFLTLMPGPGVKYYLLLPGDAFPIAPAVKVPPERRLEVGHLSYTVVYQQEARLLDALRAATRYGVRVVRYEAVIPVGTTPQESTQANRRMMTESQVAAAVVALRALGHPVEAGGRGVRITGTVAGTPAATALRKDDVVLGQDGQRVRTAVELVEAIRRRKPGQVIVLRIRRDEAEQEIHLVTIPSPVDPDRPMVGAYIETDGFEADLPFPIEIASGSVIGPSAGLMFALGIYDALTPGALGGGQPIAGTGSIGLDGRVGGVEGVAQKVIGAERVGARVFLAPRDTYPEARAAAGTIRVVPVGTFDDALAALQGQ